MGLRFCVQLESRVSKLSAKRLPLSMHASFLGCTSPSPTSQSFRGALTLVAARAHSAVSSGSSGSVRIKGALKAAVQQQLRATSASACPDAVVDSCAALVKQDLGLADDANLTLHQSLTLAADAVAYGLLKGQPESAATVSTDGVFLGTDKPGSDTMDRAAIDLSLDLVSGKYW